VLCVDFLYEELILCFSGSSIFCGRIYLLPVFSPSPGPNAQCCGSGMFIPDPSFSIPDPGSKDSRSRIRKRIKEFKYISPKMLFLSSRKYDPGCSSGSRIRILIFYPFPIPDPGVRKAPNSGSGSARLLMPAFLVAVPSSNF
jgi:hypothetical protein